MAEKVTKSVDPDEIVEREVNQAGQVYIGRDLAGESVTVAYEVNRAETPKENESTTSSGATKHRYILQQAVSTLDQLGISNYSVAEQQGMRSIPDALAELPWENPVTDSFTDGIMERISKGSDMQIEAVTTAKKPDRIIGYLGAAIENNKTLVLACPADIDTQKLDNIIYAHTDAGNVDYSDISCKYTSKTPTQLYTTDRKRYLETDYDSSIFPLWIERNGRIVCVPNSEPDSSPLAEFDPESYEIIGKTADVVSKHHYDLPKEGIVPVNIPLIPEQRFDRQPQHLDFSVLLFPATDRESGTPQLYEEGERIPVFDTE